MLDRLREVLDYNPITGVFINKVGRGRLKKGSEAGTVKEGRYAAISIDGTVYYAHRLAYMYMYGIIPDDYEIDHIDGNGLNNSIGNLRLVDRLGNNNNFSKVKGYYYDIVTDKYLASIQYNGKRKSLGRYDTEDEAREAYLKERSKLNNHGSDILAVFMVPLCVQTGIRRKRTYWLNYNNLHTEHRNTVNNLKKEFKKSYVANELELRTIEYTESFTLEYLIFLPDRLHRDINNVGSVIDKFTGDAYVELGYASDDNYKCMQDERYMFGGYDPNKRGFAQVTVRRNNEYRNY